ncbi:MAG: S49 family peptidase [Acetobacteraceae bacterium]
MIELHGLISARMGRLNLRTAAPLIDKGFAAAKGRPVILDIDSPGGSPVQSDLIASLIRRRAEKAKVDVHAVIGDVGASGGYWIACAADQIHANPMSLVGSIGVITGSFGFSELIARVGVERRLYTAGAHKARLDPFSPERADDVTFTHDLLAALHLRFQAWVKERRGSRLTREEEKIFDGSAVLGEQGLPLGLIDGFADIDGLVRKLGGERAKPRIFRPRPRGWLKRLPRLFAESVFDVIEERWARTSLLS